MAKHVGKKFSWVIKNFSSLQSKKRIYSAPVLIGDCKWRLHAYPKLTHVDNQWILCAYPKGHKVDDHLSLFLEVADLESLPSGWRRYVKFRLTLLPHDLEKDPVEEETHYWFDKVRWRCGFSSLIPFTKLEKDAGFVVNDEVIIIAEVDVFEVSGTLDASEKSKESNHPLKKTKLNDDCAESNEPLKEASSFKESMVVNGFQVLPSQVETVKRIFERHPDIAVDFRAKNQHLRTTCMNFLLSLIETLCKSLQELSNEDLEVANIALTCLKDVNFKVDWLEKKLDQVKEKKETEQAILAELLATRATLSFDDIV